ncbi:MAG: HAD-IA family hydrolase [Micropepsaceae bacterium]
MRLTDFSILSFDCYGTLIDWETGIWNALQPLLVQAKGTITREQALAAFGETEPEIEHEHPGLLYREILTRAHRAMSERWNLSSSATLDAAFGDAVGNWPTFPDTPGALLWLKQHYKLVILSNVDRQSFAATNIKLGVTFDAVCTAEDIGSYKPDTRNFDYLLNTVARLGHGKSDLLHVAQSLYHDLEPAERMGIRRCWINRRNDHGTGSGATKAVSRVPTLDFQFPSLGAFADAALTTV